MMLTTTMIAFYDKYLLGYLLIIPIILSGIMTTTVLIAPYVLLVCSVLALVLPRESNDGNKRPFLVTLIGWTTILLYVFCIVGPIPMVILMGRPESYRPLALNLHNVTLYGVSFAGVCAGYAMLRRRKGTFLLYFLLFVWFFWVMVRQTIQSTHSHAWHQIFTSTIAVTTYGLISRYAWLSDRRTGPHP
jgi:hypothetical protein